MQTAWNHWTAGIADRLTEQLGRTVLPSELVIPPDAAMGDVAFACFALAKEQKINPAELAKQIAAAFSAGTGSDAVQAAANGPYVNFIFETGDAVHRVIRDIETAGSAYGSGEQKKDGQTMFEYANPNTHKEIHIGHLRNLILGGSLVRLFAHANMSVIPVSYINDVGSNVGKLLWYLVWNKGMDIRAFTEEQARTLLTEIPAEKHTGNYLGEMYAQATGYINAHPETKDDISHVQRALEAHEPSWQALWQETRRWSMDELYAVFEELGVTIERQYFESDILDRSKIAVEELERKGMAHLSQGALIVDLEDLGLGVFLIRKSDGTLLYSAKDIALAEQKNEEYPQLTESLLLVDARQTLYFKQLFTVLSRLGMPQRFEQVGYEIVTLKEGVMSSRKGNIITYNAFRDALLNYAREEVLKRHADWTEGKVEHTAWTVAIGGLKFAFLKQDSDKVIVFDQRQALAFDGSTGPYCQYAATRLGAILRKSGKPILTEEPLTRAFDHASEKNLALALAQLPNVVSRAARDRKPSLVAQWCLEVSQRMNDFYRDVPVLESKTELLNGRLRFCAAARAALGKGLELLGIPLPDEM